MKEPGPYHGRLATVRSMILTSLRLVLATYCLVLAVGAVFGFHRQLLAYPVRISYSTFRLLLLLLSGGRLRMMPLTRKVRRRGVSAFRGAWEALSERRRGEALPSPPKVGGWRSGGKEAASARGGAAIGELAGDTPQGAKPSEDLCPVHGVPLLSPLRFDEDTGEALPEGTTHTRCVESNQETPLPPAWPALPEADDEGVPPPSFNWPEIP
jgi:hypothetical protein